MHSMKQKHSLLLLSIITLNLHLFKGIILSGSPYSVYEKDSPHADAKLWTKFAGKIPILGICYGLQEIAWVHGGKVEPHDKKEYGHAEIEIMKQQGKESSKLFAGLGDKTSVKGDYVEV